MSEIRELLEARSRRGATRGADATLDGGRGAARRAARGRRLSAAAATVVLVGAVVAAGTWWAPDEDSPVATPSSGRDAASTTEATTATTAAGTSEGLGDRQVIGFSPDDGLVVVTDAGERPVGGHRGEEGATDLTVAPDGRSVVHAWVATGCQANLARTELDGSSETIAEGATLPAIDPGGGFLAYVHWDTCQGGSWRVIVRDLETGDERSVDAAGDASPADVAPVDLEWHDERLLVLRRDRAGSSESLVSYRLPSDGTPVLDDEWSPATGRSWTDVESPLAGEGFVTITEQARLEEPFAVPEATSFVQLDLASGATEERHESDGQVTSFDVSADGAVVFVRTLPKIPGERAVVDELWLWEGGAEMPLGEGVNSVQWRPAVSSSSEG